MTNIPARDTRAILKALQATSTPSLLSLRGYPRSRLESRQNEFTVSVCSTRSADITETVMEERPYSHFLGTYTGDISEADLKEDIESMIRDKYRTAAV